MVVSPIEAEFGTVVFDADFVARRPARFSLEVEVNPDHPRIGVTAFCGFLSVDFGDTILSVDSPEFAAAIPYLEGTDVGTSFSIERVE